MLNICLNTVLTFNSVLIKVSNPALANLRTSLANTRAGFSCIKPGRRSGRVFLHISRPAIRPDFSRPDIIQSGRVGPDIMHNHNNPTLETGFCETGFYETGFCETGFGETGFGEMGFGETGFSETGFGETGFGETGYSAKREDT